MRIFPLIDSLRVTLKSKFEEPNRGSLPPLHAGAEAPVTAEAARPTDVAVRIDAVEGTPGGSVGTA